MTARVLVTSAGNAPGNNLVRSFRAGPEPVFIAGCHDDQFVLKNSTADKNYLTLPVGHPQWARALGYILEAEEGQVIIRRPETFGEADKKLLLPSEGAERPPRDAQVMIAAACELQAPGYLPL